MKFFAAHMWWNCMIFLMHLFAAHIINLTYIYKRPVYTWKIPLHTLHAHHLEVIAHVYTCTKCVRLKWNILMHASVRNYVWLHFTQRTNYNQIIIVLTNRFLRFSCSIVVFLSTMFFFANAIPEDEPDNHFHMGRMIKRIIQQSWQNNFFVRFDWWW